MQPVFSVFHFRTVSLFLLLFHPSSRSAFYSGSSDEELYRVTASSTSTVLGDGLAADLYDELLAFTPSVDSPLLRTSCTAGYGTITLHAYKLNYGGAVYPSSAGVAIGTVTVAAKVA